MRSMGKVDLYKEGAFILEAKQSSDDGAAEVGTAKRGTPSRAMFMNKAYGQALGCVHTFAKPVPFIVTCDIGHCFDLYATFDGSLAYRQFRSRSRSRSGSGSGARVPRDLTTIDRFRGKRTPRIRSGCTANHAGRRVTQEDARTFEVCTRAREAGDGAR
jgi:hypothetical protein